MTDEVERLRAEIATMRGVIIAAVRVIKHPAWSGVCDDEELLARDGAMAALETALHDGGWL